MRRKSEIQPTKSEDAAVAALCPACGLCCNGVLFADVELQRSENTARLRALGVPLFARGVKQCFRQPCACFDGRLCRVYDDRPERCRSFDCRLVQRLRAGELTEAAALKRIAAARRAADTVRERVRQLGEQDETMPLSRRCSRIMAQPLDFGGDETMLECRSALMLAVDRLAKMLERDFLG